MSTVANTTREYLVLRISEIQETIRNTHIDESIELAVEFARINELRNVLTVLNGGVLPVEMEAHDA